MESEEWNGETKGKRSKHPLTTYFTSVIPGFQKKIITARLEVILFYEYHHSVSLSVRN
jgi:hypothetical protein